MKISTYVERLHGWLNVGIFTMNFVVSRVMCAALLFLSLQSQGNAETELEFFDHLRAIEKSEFDIRAITLDFVGDPAVQDINLSLRTVPIEVVTAAGKNDIMALYKLECMERECSITARFDLDFSMEGLNYRIVPKLVLIDYSVEPTGAEVTTLANETAKIFAQRVVLEGHASWGDEPDLFWIVDDPSKMMQKTVRIDLADFTKEQKIGLIKNCYNKCERVKVFGTPVLVMERWLSIKADKVVETK